MKNKKGKKIKLIFDYIIEKCLELFEHIYYLFKKRKKWTSNLTEEYQINPAYKEEPYVCSFLHEREKALIHNGYKMKVVYINAKAEKNIIGTAILRRKNKIISSATLKTKANDTDSSKLIYWIFEK